jgi:hypothetical protein
MLAILATFGSTGCVSLHQGTLVPTIPNIGTIAAGHKIRLSSTKDLRKATLPKEEGGANGFDLKAGQVLVLTESPATTFDTSLAQLFENAGFELAKPSDPMSDGDIKVDAEINVFNIGRDGSGGWVVPLMTATIRYGLVFSKGEKTLATKHFHGEISGRPYGNVALFHGDTKYLNEAFTKVLKKTAKYVQSPTFQNMVLGVPLDKIKTTDDSDDDD